MYLPTDGFCGTGVVVGMIVVVQKSIKNEFEISGPFVLFQRNIVQNKVKIKMKNSLRVNVT